ncbi:hypothetical protein [Lacinutrix sp. 5H-3-7-4]|uniref:hypothetical protein n=1 Tax=Lacinutrix sp. (strain 5H-3-7-4) TaxID=983544 RepID=UPI0002ED6AF9|nr:hypothetical protein [Lacinutrix sp. 5H-3-7-4]
MKKTIYISILLTLGIWNFSFSQKTEVEKYYVRVDTSFVSELKLAYETSTEELIKTLEVKNDKREDLGFGYQLKQSGKGLGSMTINYEILYYKNEIVSYRLTTRIPNKSKRLKKLYKEKLSTLFKVDEDYKVEPIYFGIENANEPLAGIEKRNRGNLNEIMSPFSSIIFGTYCGESMTLMNNRKLFDKIISIDNCEYLLYSKNPATRLMAVEFYYCNLTEFSDVQKKSIDTRIEELKRKPMLTRTCSGCIIGVNMTEKIITELKNCR